MAGRRRFRGSDPAPRRAPGPTVGVSGAGQSGRDVRFCAPEVVMGMPATFQSDIYSAGVIIYKLMTGRLPFSAEQTVEMGLEKNIYEPVPPQDLNPRIPPMLNAGMLKALKPKAAQRYASASEFLSDLLACRAIMMRSLATSAPQPIPMANPEPPPPPFRPQQYSAHISLNATPAGGGDPPPPLKLDDNIDDTRQFKVRQVLTITAIMLFAAIFIGLIGFGWSMIRGHFGWAGQERAEIQVPDVIGRQETEAKFMLGQKQLRAEIEYVFNNRVAKGLVIKQDPMAGTRVKEGRIVRLTVSRGEEELTVPDFHKMLLSDAEKLAEEMGLRIRVTSEYSDDVAKDQIIDQEPPAGAKVSTGNLIKLFVSKGPEPHVIAMPDLVGKSINDAYQMLEAQNIPYGDVKTIPTNEAEAGAVVSQSVLPGTEIDVKKMENVIVYVAEAPAGPDDDGGIDGLPDPDGGGSFGEVKKQHLSLKVTETGTSEVVVVLIDMNSRREVYRQNHAKDDTIDLDLEGEGDVYVKVYINGILKKESHF